MFFLLIGTLKCSKLSYDFYVLSFISPPLSWGQKPQTQDQVFMSKKTAWQGGRRYTLPRREIHCMIFQKITQLQTWTLFHDCITAYYNCFPILLIPHVDTSIASHVSFLLTMKRYLCQVSTQVRQFWQIKLIKVGFQGQNVNIFKDLDTYCQTIPVST